MLYSLLQDHSGRLYDARIELEPGAVLIHSRGGPTGGRLPRNPDYEVALATILKRLCHGNGKTPPVLSRILLDSGVARREPEDARILATQSDLAGLTDDEALALVRRQMKQWGQAPGTKGGNSTKALRIETTLQSVVALRELLALTERIDRTRGDERLSNEEQNRVKPAHVRRSVERLLSGEDAPHFGSSTKYDVLTPDGTRLAPKKVFGLALEEAGVVKTAMPKHFSAGWSVPCFPSIQAAGYPIVPKVPEEDREDAAEATQSLGQDEETTLSIEGNPRLVTHLKRERNGSLARKKKVDFIKKHGRLFCEECNMDPVEAYGAEAGAACIQVHHSQTQVKDMKPGHLTRLEDLQCLCANCHSVTHRRLALGL